MKAMLSGAEPQVALQQQQISLSFQFSSLPPCGLQTDIYIVFVHVALVMQLHFKEIRIKNGLLLP